MSVLTAKEINEVLGLETVGQSAIREKAREVIIKNRQYIDVAWYLYGGDIWWGQIRIVINPIEERFAYHVPRFDIWDIDADRLFALLEHNADYTDENGYSFLAKEPLVDALRSFTQILIKTWN